MTAPKFLGKFYKAKGIKRAFNAVAVHPYAPSIHNLKQQMTKLHKVIKRKHDNAKMWITERENRPQWASCPRRRAGRLDGQDVADHRRGHEAGAKRRLPLLRRLIRSLLLGSEPSHRYVGLPALARVVDRQRHSQRLASS